MRVTLVLQALLACLLIACGQEAPTPSASESLSEAKPLAADSLSSSDSARVRQPVDRDSGHDVALAASESEPVSKKAARAPGERPLPGFSGPTLAGTRLSISSLIGRRMLLFFFNPEIDTTGTVADAVAEIAKQQRQFNFRVVGIGVGSNTSTVRSFTRAHGIDFPVIDDSSGQITSLLRLQGPLLLLGADAEGYVTFVHPGFDTSGDDAVQKIATRLRESLRIPAAPHTGALIQYRKAPLFETEDIDGKPFDLAALDGKPKIVIFFLHTCPHCHKALAFFKQQLASMPEDKRPSLVAISLQNRPSAIRISLGELGLDFFSPLIDPGQEIAKLYGLSGSVPDIFMVDAQGDIIYRMQGWREDRDPALMRMYLYRIAGEKIPMLLSRSGFTGNDACTVCHQQEASTWELTSHARAFDDLVTHGQERDGECVSCHVVGFDQPGGYSFDRPASHLENVGCETCHGRGGPHLSPDFLGKGGYAAVCVTCHDTKHSLGFDFETFLPGISHVKIAAMTDEQRIARFAEGITHRQLLPSTADYVGSDSCQSCHTAEFETWAKSPHAHAIESLAQGKQKSNSDCLRCHTTAYDQPGGFPAGAEVADHTDLARVGCESCHGPGGDHIAEDARHIGTIVSLGDKCDSCVILQICGSCHDPANDADFEFSVQEHIERQRHGTLEPGTGKPLGTAAGMFGPPLVDVQVAHGLHRLDTDAAGGR